MTVEIPSDRNRPHGHRHANGNDNFINPYNFVSTPARPNADAAGLGNAAPAGHAEFAAGTYTGTIPITIITRTPLLLPDQGHAKAADADNPRRVGTRTRGQLSERRTSAPLLMGSSVKGMLRSAYEAITNSTFGVVSDTHNRPGSIRMMPKEALGLCPGVVEDDQANPRHFRVRYLTHLRPTGWRGNDPLPTPHVPATLGSKFAVALGIPAPDLDTREVQAWIHLLRHVVHTHRGAQTYHFWRVSDLALAGGTLAAMPSAPVVGGHDTIAATPVSLRVRGRLHWTEAPFAGKHDERLVVTEVLDPAEWHVDTLAVSDVDRARWDGIIEAYLAAHRTESDTFRATHYGTYARSADTARRWAWRHGRTLHVGFDEIQGKKTPWFTPAMIGRRAFAVSPSTLIPGRNRPSTEFDTLSPADRVFGWVRQGRPTDADAAPGSTAYRGQLRVSAPVPDHTEGDPPPIEHFVTAVRLGILNSPKPTQYRFYGGDGKQQPRDNRRERNVADGYANKNSRLRGRKFYLPQPEVFDHSDYWNPVRKSTNETANVGNTARYREYLGVTPGADDNQLNKVSLATNSWVRPGITFRATLFVQNLTAVELGALLWLLALPTEASMTMGLGKPLGFGAVRVTADWETVLLYEASTIAERYKSLSKAQTACDQSKLQELVAEYDAVLQGDADLARIRKEFLDIAFGYEGVPVHYPRARPTGQRLGRPAPQSELFKWWVANEQPDNYHWLPEVGTPVAPTLPYLNEKRQQQ